MSSSALVPGAGRVPEEGTVPDPGGASGAGEAAGASEFTGTGAAPALEGDTSLVAAAPTPLARRRRTVLWATVATAVVVVALFAVIVSAKPSSEVLGSSPLLGKPAPALSGPGLRGGHYSLTQFHGKWVLVNFMATWCVPCQEEMPQLLLFSRQHAQAGSATVLTVAYDPANVAELSRFLNERGARWPAVDDPNASVSYAVQSLPSSFLVAPGGTVVAYVEGGVRANELDTWIKQAEAKGYAG
jgi:thiol-disulfide isomerase/thioredoxin